MSTADPWSDLRAHTAARLALGRSGNSLPTDEVLRFSLAHAQARDAVQRPLDMTALATQLQAPGVRTFQVGSAAVDRTTFLLRPDLGRRLAESSRTVLETEGGSQGVRPDLVLVVADGLSAPAIERNALPMLAALDRQAPENWRVGPVVIATQARVALGDEIGQALGAALVAMLIGE
ncbi:MAG TPA: ethanolamine ammonia-lyase subunit EutC, partial [Lautropia sp.]|nr:ethanolamine ammonia-lyase subunit EutC [Lautropia sp.]